MNDNKVFRSRQHDRREYAELLMRELLEARDKTDPEIPESAGNKDAQAFAALNRAGELVEVLAGWALDHVCGLSLSGQKMLPGQADDRRPNKGKQHPDYVAYRQVADCHDNEARGQEVHFTAPASPEARRLILRNLVFANAAGFPSWLRRELVEALDALGAGIVNPIFDHKKSKKIHEILKIMLQFVVIAQYQSAAYGMSLEEARAEVGNTIEIDGETIKSWERRLRKGALGALEVDSRITRARNGASHVRHAMSEVRAGRQTSLGHVAEHHERQYGAAALARAVAQWREAAGAKKRLR